MTLKGEAPPDYRRIELCSAIQPPASGSTGLALRTGHGLVRSRPVSEARVTALGLAAGPAQPKKAHA